MTTVERDSKLPRTRRSSLCALTLLKEEAGGELEARPHAPFSNR